MAYSVFIYIFIHKKILKNICTNPFLFLLTLVFLSLNFISCVENDPEKTEDFMLTEDSAEDTIDIQPIINTDFDQDISAYKSVVNIIRETGLDQNFVIIPGEDVDDVIAYIKDKERVLSYNPEFMDKVNTDSNWVGISILARQIGHHLGNHELADGKPSYEETLDADRYAGFVLQKMGASIDEAISAIEVSAADNNDFDINKNKRVAAMVQGFNKAKSLSVDTNYIAQNEKPKTNENSTEEIKEVDANKTKRIQPDFVYKVYLAIDNSIYFIDDENIVYEEVESDKYDKVGEKKASTKPGFDWIFVVKDNSYGVDLKGRLWAFSTEGDFKVIGQAVKINI